VAQGCIRLAGRSEETDHPSVGFLSQRIRAHPPACSLKGAEEVARLLQESDPLMQRLVEGFCESLSL
jgi:hypothetical protein